MPRDDDDIHDGVRWHTSKRDDEDDGLQRREQQQLEALQNWTQHLIRKTQLGLPVLSAGDENRVQMRGDPVTNKDDILLMY
jgi:hypothetical protein